jgi:hypothetical protein
MTLLYKAFGEVGNNTLNSVNSPKERVEYKQPPLKIIINLFFEIEKR